MRKTMLCALLALLTLPGVAQAARPGIEVLPNRADAVSAGDALVAISPAADKVTLNGADVTSEFAKRSNGRYEGLLTGLRSGSNTLTATNADGSSSTTIVNHP